MRFLHRTLWLSGLAFIVITLVPVEIKAQVVPYGTGVPSVSNVPALEPANLGGRINYVRTWDAWKPITDPAQITQQTIADVKVNTAYVDGQGRVIQTVAKQMSPNAKDLVSYKQFDLYGRETIQPLSYVSTATNGDFKANPFSEQQYYYSTGSVNNNQYTGEQIYFGRTAFETSPLGRPDTIMAPGNSWAGSKRGLRYLYQVNTVNDSVRLWTIADAANSTPSTSATYGVAQLYKTITIDENGNQVVEYKDKKGQVVLKKVQTTDTPGTAHMGWLNTYYIYDDYGLLRVVIQPEAVAAMLLAGNWSLSSLMNELCFRYEYDQRNRVIIKKVPGAGEVWMVYDARDRLVMTQDANLRGLNRWLYTTYDVVNRPLTTGILSSSSDRATHQSAAYSSVAYPNLANFTIIQQLSQNWYDYYLQNPQFSSQDVSKLVAGDNPHPVTVAVSGLIYGKSTHTQTNVTGTIGDIEMKTVFYDEKGRPIQVHSQYGELNNDITTNRYDFSGKLICTYQRHYYMNAAIFQDLTIRTRMLYDAGGRLTKVWKEVNDANEKLIVQNSYDELGQLKSKKLAPDYAGGAGMETLNYEYNIRGWLKNINKDYTAGTSSSNWFGQSLSYDWGFTLDQYNGNISGQQWRSRGDGERRAYGYTYDKVNRLTTADFTQYTNSLWNTNAGFDFTTSNLSYDANGNIKTMKQKGWKLGGSIFIDDLLYTYETNSNKLKQVVDNQNNNNSYLGDFKYDVATKTSQDYYYDNNGNLVRDLNKQITDNTYDGIEYNFLNLPQKIRVLNKGVIDYGYGASGIKLVKRTTDNLVSPAKVTTITYYNGIIYQNDTLQYFGHEEGRIRYTAPAGGGGGSYQYDYFVKDHLGNVRLVLTEEQKTDMYPAATMETANATVEETYYSNLPSTRVNVPSGYPANTPPGNAKVAKVNGNTQSDPEGIKIGPAILLKVMAGDKFNITVNSWWKNFSAPGTPSNPYNDLLSALSGSIAGQPGAHATSSQLQSSAELTGTVTSFLNSQNGYNSSLPKSFINWLLLDEHFNYVSSSSGFEQVGSSNTYTTHTRTNLPVDKSGYLYIFVSNSTQNIDVFFDNLQVSHVRGPLVEENHYYAFGLQQAGLSSKALAFGRENKKKYQQYELNSDFDLNLYESFYRTHDPQIGRFCQIDPKPDNSIGLYTAMNNNPIRFSDLFGDKVDSMKLTGDQKSIDEFISILESRTANKYKQDANGYLTRVKEGGSKYIKGKTSSALGHLVEQISTDKNHDIVLDFSSNTEKNDQFLIDQASTNLVDIEDIKKVKSEALQSALIGHFLGERYVASKFNFDMKENEQFEASHQYGLLVEGLIMSEMTGNKFSLREQITKNMGYETKVTFKYGDLKFVTWVLTNVSDGPSGKMHTDFEQEIWK